MARGTDDRPGQEPEAEAHDRRTQPGEIGLAFAADIEEAGMEGDRNGKAGEDEIGGVVEQIAPALQAADRAFQHDPHGFERIFADDDNDQAGDEERHSEIEQRNERDIHPGREVHRARRPLRGLLS